MTDFPDQLARSGCFGMLSTASYEGSILGQTYINGGQAFNGSTAWATANTAIFVPVILPFDATVYQMAWYNGATVSASNHIDVGIYDIMGTRKVSTGSTAQGTASTIQTVDVTDTPLSRGLYWLAQNCDNTAATFTMGSASLLFQKSSGCCQSAIGAIALPSTVTLGTALAANKAPLIVASLESTAI